jgi:hypothetical protein
MTDNQTTQQPAPKMTGSERVQLFRKRKAKDNLLVEIELLPTERDKLIRMGLLSVADRNNKIEVRDALYAFLEKCLDPPQAWPLGSWQSNGAHNG